MKNTKYRIAVVGGGVQGLSLLDILLTAGHDVTLFESKDRVGGVWNNFGRVPYMSLQLSSRHFRFPFHPHDKDLDMPEAEYIREYIQSFITKQDLARYFHCNIEIKNARPISETEYSLYDTSNTEIEGKFNFVIYTGSATIPKIPPLFTDVPNVIHSSNFSHDKINIVRNKRCVVYGGSKSAAEMALAAARNGAFVTWVARRFSSFGQFTSNTTISKKQVMKALPSLVRGDMTALFPYKILPDDEPHIGSGNFLTSEEYSELMELTRIRDEIELFQDDNTLRLKHSGKTLAFDYILLGTGYIPSEISTDNCNDHHVFSSNYVNPEKLLTSFGPPLSHIRATLIKKYVESEPKTTIQDFSHDALGVKDTLWQLKYLTTNSVIEPIDDFQPLWLYIIIIVVCLFVILVLVYIIRKIYTRK